MSLKIRKTKLPQTIGIATSLLGTLAFALLIPSNASANSDQWIPLQTVGSLTSGGALINGCDTGSDASDNYGGSNDVYNQDLAVNDSGQMAAIYIKESPNLNGMGGMSGMGGTVSCNYSLELATHDPGSEITTQTIATNIDTSSTTRPSVSINNNGNIAVAWVDQDEYMYIASSQSASSSFHTQQVTTVTNDTTYPQIFIDDSGTVTAAWIVGGSSSKDIYYALGSVGSTLTVKTTPLNSTTSDIANMSLNGNSEGEVLLLWTQDDDVVTSYRSGTGNFASEQNVHNDSTSTNLSNAPVGVVSSDGSSIVVWAVDNGSYTGVRMKRRKAVTTSWSSSYTTLSTSGVNATYPTVTSNSSGKATFAWKETLSSSSYEIDTQSFTWTLTSSTSTGKQAISTTDSSSMKPILTSNSNGLVALLCDNNVAFKAEDQNNFETPFEIAATASSDQTAAVDDEGSLVVASAFSHDYRDIPDGSMAVYSDDAQQESVELGVVDRVAPTITTDSGSQTIQTGEEINLSAETNDRWGNPTTLTWLLNGTTPIGTANTINYVFTTAGVYTVTVKATDQANNTSESNVVTFTVLDPAVSTNTVTQPPTTTAPTDTSTSQTTTVQPDTTAPTISGLGISPSRPSAKKLAKTKLSKRKLKLNFTLSESATVTVKIEAKTVKKRKGKKSKASWKKVKSFDLGTVTSGANTTNLIKKYRKFKKLGYRITVTATDLAGNRASKTKTFTVKK